MLWKKIQADQSFWEVWGSRKTSLNRFQIESNVYKLFFCNTDFKQPDQKVVFLQQEICVHPIDVNVHQGSDDDWIFKRFYRFVFCNKRYSAIFGILYSPFIEGRFLAFPLATEVDEDRLAEVSIWCKLVCILTVVGSWYNVWEGFPVAFNFVTVWKGLSLVLNILLLAAKFWRTKKGLDKKGTVEVNVFWMNVLPFDLSNRFDTVELFS